MAGQHSACTTPAQALLLLLSIATLAGQALASALTGSGFPFEGCKYQKWTQNRWLVDWSYYEVQKDSRGNPKSSRACLQIFRFDAEFCSVPKGIRCCRTAVQKLKMFTDARCEKSIKDVTVNGKRMNSIQWEKPRWRGKTYSIVKFTGQGINIPHDKVDGSTICWTMTGKCPTLETLSAPAARSKGYLEFGLYDKKVNGYECCPIYVLDTKPIGNDDYPPPAADESDLAWASPPPTGALGLPPPGTIRNFTAAALPPL